MGKVPWEERWFHDVPELIRRVKGHYEEEGKLWARVAAKKVKDSRKWVGFDPELLVSQCESMGVLYVPKAVEPGPLVMFPEFDLHGEPTRAQTKPFYEMLGKSKYVTLGVRREEFLGPVWLGNQDETLGRVMETGVVVVCEGPFDLLALRLACPECPSLCSLTKKLSGDHVDYLRLLGVNICYLMYDNEDSKQGETAMQGLIGEYEGILDIRALCCPAGDPSECLELKSQQRALRSVLADLVV
jgi:hypothetical protein